MNNIDELITLISENGGAASLDELCLLYGRKHHMLMFNGHKAVILVTLNSNQDKVFFDSNSNKWLLSSNENKNYLFVSDNVLFPTIRKAMLQLFDKSVPSQGGFFSVNDNLDAWFPQPGNGEWSNVLSEDGKYWNETPSEGKKTTDPSKKPRCVFVKLDDGYKFTGAFGFIGKNEEGIRIYEMIDDKIEIKSIVVTQDEEKEKEKFKQWLMAKTIENGKAAGKTAASNTVAIYVRTIKKISDKLINEGRIDASLYLTNDISLLYHLYDEMLSGEGELHEINQNGNRTWSSAVKKLIEMREEQLNLTSDFYVVPTIVSTWNYFEKERKVGERENFVATKDMKIGDFILVYIGKKNSQKEAGVYALAKVLTSPSIFLENENDYCYNKLSVCCEYFIASQDCLIDMNKSIEIAKQVQNTHVIEKRFYNEIRKILNVQD